MSEAPRLDLKQTQSLVMTPQLQQAIKMLQLNNQKLAELVEKELEHNPLLDKPDKQDDSTGEDEGTQDKPQHEAEKKPPSDDYDPGSAMAGVGSGGSHNFENPEYSLENTLSGTQTLRDHLEEQVKLSFADETDRAIAAALIDRLDESGYLQAQTDQLAGKLGTEADRIAAVLEKLQSFDPPGVFARDLRECLAIQLREQDRLDPAMQTLLDNLNLLAERDFDALAQKCGVDAEDIADMAAEIRTLNPKPALEFEHFVTQTVIPDVIMKKLPPSAGGGWGVELNTETLPKVLVNRRYYAEVKKTARNKKEIQYLRDRLTAANWLVKALDMRAQTILKVASEIIAQQDAFFLYGVEFLRPLILRDIAQEIGMHESTVSRVTTNKYIGTPRGIFELKYFFSTAIPATGASEAHSSEAVKAKIRTLVDNENPQKVLSDDAIVTALKKDGIDIARRTVAKYREAMHIPSSVMRRRQKKNTGG